MIPLTPNERREVETLKDLIIKGWQTSDCRIAHWQELEDNCNDALIMHVHDEDTKDLWLKVLSMALEHNDKLNDEWRSKK